MSFKEESVFKSKSYEVEITQDQSPTLRPDNKESMHHMGGAASESVYLYYEALSRYVQQNPKQQKISVLSFGFGMGYNELLTALFFLKNKMDINRLTLVSYEKDLFLYELFNAWLNGGGEQESIFDGVYLGIQRALPVDELPLTVEIVKQALLELLKNSRWLQLGAVMSIDDFNGPYDVVYYDAFSAKTNEHLWSEDFLNRFFLRKLSPHFVFSTYACTSVMKRVAAGNQCRFDKREGFMGKRNSSLISR